MKSKVQQTPDGQVILIPKELAFPDDVQEVEIISQGKNTLLIASAGHLWDSFFEGPPAPADFMVDREQPPYQERAFDWDD